MTHYRVIRVQLDFRVGEMLGLESIVEVSRSPC